MKILRPMLVRMPGAVFLAAACLKIASPIAFAESLNWLGFSGRSVLVVGFATVVWETILGVLLLIVPLRTAFRSLGVATLVAFSALLAYMLIAGDAPSCGCLGALVEFRSGRAEIAFGLGRNAILVSILIWPACSTKKSGIRVPQPTSD